MSRLWSELMLLPATTMTGAAASMALSDSAWRLRRTTTRAMTAAAAMTASAAMTLAMMTTMLGPLEVVVSAAGTAGQGECCWQRQNTVAVQNYKSTYAQICTESQEHMIYVHMT